MDAPLTCPYCGIPSQVTCGNELTANLCSRRPTLEDRQRAASSEQRSSFAPDERPPGVVPPWEPEGGEFQPFTPQQEKRLREIAWDAAETAAKYENLSRMGLVLKAHRARDAFLRGGGQ